MYPALLPLMRTPRLPVVDWTDAPADLNGLVRFAERRNLVSARVPSHVKRSLIHTNIEYTLFTPCQHIGGIEIWYSSTYSYPRHVGEGRCSASRSGRFTCENNSRSWNSNPRPSSLVSIPTTLPHLMYNIYLHLLLPFPPWHSLLTTTIWTANILIMCHNLVVWPTISEPSNFLCLYFKISLT